MEDTVGLGLLTLNNQIRRYLDHHSHKQEIDQITGTNAWIIFFLSDHQDQDVFQRDLEKHFHVTRSTVSKVLQLMEEKGFIKRESVTHDARLKKLSLTQKSMEILKMVRQDQQELEKRLIRGFTQEELDVLRAYLRRLKENMQNN